jgi:hypothetical protein
VKDIRNHRCGNVRMLDGRYFYSSPHNLATFRDPRMRDYFAARLRGEYPPMPGPWPVEVPRFVRRFRAYSEPVPDLHEDLISK